MLNKILTKNKSIQLVFFIWSLGLCTYVYANEPWPVKPISMTIPFPPGGVAPVV